jgi:hypothetical protein
MKSRKLLILKFFKGEKNIKKRVSNLIEKKLKVDEIVKTN